MTSEDFSLPAVFEYATFEQVGREEGATKHLVWCLISRGSVCFEGGFLMASKCEPIWMATGSGLQIYNPISGIKGQLCEFQRYNDISQNPGLSLSYTGLGATSDRLLNYLNGVAVFNPNYLTDNKVLPTLNLVCESVNGQNLAVREFANGDYESLQLRHWQNTLAFGFASNSLVDKDSVKYRYRLRNFDEDWAETNQHSLRYTHLPPGQYAFQLLAVNAAGYHALYPLEWHFRIRPPWWVAWWAFMVYILLAIGAAFSYYVYKKRQWILAVQLRLEHKETQRLKQLETVKSSLYTNITHEFRTPLTIISGMAKQIKDNPKDWFSEGLQMIDRNSQGLLRLVNQMLNLSRLEAETMPINLVRGDVVAFLKYVFESFHALSSEQGIGLRFIANCDGLVMEYDSEKLHEIVANLLSNAIKFTEKNGQVTLRVDFEDNQNSPTFAITVTDTGVGIPKEKLLHVFDRFYRAGNDATSKFEGTGIGLALTNEMVKLLGGKISVESEVGKGTIFVVRLPANNCANLEFTTAELLLSPNVAGELTSSADPFKVIATKSSTTPILLIVEDDPDMVQYLRSFLSINYQIEVASNGKIGIEKAMEIVPDVIISEVMIPKVDGFELCETLKKEGRTSHVPIILLTATTDASSRIEALGKGADAFLTKPFDKEELIVQLRKMVELRKTLHDRFANGIEPFLKDERHTTEEEQFAKQLLQILEGHYAEEDFDITELCHDLHLSRAQCYRKITALTGQSVAHLIRSFRLKKARHLLETTDLNISQVALDVGFKHLSHFSHSFQHEYGINPSELRK